ncbi:hypothetical protein AAGT13_10085, partial [Azotobacter salinestris]
LNTWPDRAQENSGQVGTDPAMPRLIRFRPDKPRGVSRNQGFALVSAGIIPAVAGLKADSTGDWLRTACLFGVSQGVALRSCRRHL